MTTPDPQDLSARLRAEAPTPPQPATFFDTLGWTAGQSTPSAAAGIFARVRQGKVAAVIAGTALLLSGAAYAGGLMGGQGPDAATLTPATSTADKSRADQGSDEPVKAKVDRVVDKADKHPQKNKNDDAAVDQPIPPMDDPDDDADSPRHRGDCDRRHDGDGRWGHWGDHDGDWGDHDGDGDWGDHDGDGDWGDDNGDGDWGDHDGDWGDHDGDWGDHDGGSDR